MNDKSTSCQDEFVVVRIACLSWGSLVWNPGTLQLSSSWFHDGPKVPVEFARQSKGGRLTLVIDQEFQPVPSLWAWMNTTNLEGSIENLRERERTSRKMIGVWKVNQDPPPLIPELKDWAEEKHAAAVIWTALPPKFHGTNGKVPSIEEAVSFLQSLDKEQQFSAREYVCRAPEQVRTPYRCRFEVEFGWYPIGKKKP